MQEQDKVEAEEAYAQGRHDSTPANYSGNEQWAAQKNAVHSPTAAAVPRMSSKGPSGIRRQLACRGSADGM